MNVLDLFSGIGGFSLGLERAGMRTVQFCEIDPYCRAILAKHWPGIPCHDDIRSLTGVAADVICGGFPCQDVSDAGKKAGLAGARSGLWREYSRLIGEVRPRYAIVENVSGLYSRGLGDVLGDLAQIGYDAEWHCIPAAAIGAPHRRDRIWIVAYPRGEQFSGRRCEEGDLLLTEWAPAGTIQFRGRWEHWLSENGETVPDSASWRLEDSAQFNSPQERAAAIWGSRWRHADGCGCATGWCLEPDVGRVANGVSKRVDRIRCLGNAIVPQIAEIIGRAIMKDYADDGRSES